MPQQNAGWLDIMVPAHLGCLRKWLLKQVLLLYRGQLQHSDYKYYSVYIYILPCCERWEAIANFLKIHIADSNRSAKDVLAKAKQLQKNGKCGCHCFVCFFNLFVFFCFVQVTRSTVLFVCARLIGGHTSLRVIVFKSENLLG